MNSIIAEIAKMSPPVNSDWQNLITAFDRLSKNNHLTKRDRETFAELALWGNVLTILHGLSQR